MKKVKAKINEEESTMCLEPESLEDLWTVSRLAQAGDICRGVAWRRFKTRDLTRAESGEKKKIRVELRIENVEFAEAANRVRLTGVILRGEPEEFAPLGEHQTLDVEIGTRVEIQKQKISVFERKILENALKRSKRVDALIIAMDDERATIACLNSSGVRFACELESEASKRQPKTYAELRKKFFSEILKQVEAATSQGSSVIVAGPGFAKDEFRKYVERAAPETAKKIFFENASNAERAGVNEVIKRGIARKILGEQKQTIEWEKLEEFKKRIARGGLAVYGADEVKRAVEAGAASEVLVLDEVLRKNEAAQTVVEKAERLGASVFVFDSRSEAGREFAGFALACFMRYKL
ncbi:MAG: mRNA surveillance protein pelota [Candidatus Norongarragalinales archaeon]